VPYEFKLTRQVEFSETDMAGLVHFSNFFRYMESTEHAFFRSLGLSINTRRTEGSLGWPRVHAECDYFSPLRFEDEFEITLLVREKREKSLAYSFIFRKLNGEPEREVARGSIVVTCVKWDPKTDNIRSTPIPAEIADLIEVAPQELLER